MGCLAASKPTEVCLQLFVKSIIVFFIPVVTALEVAVFCVFSLPMVPLSLSGVHMDHCNDTRR